MKKFRFTETEKKMMRNSILNSAHYSDIFRLKNCLHTLSTCSPTAKDRKYYTRQYALFELIYADMCESGELVNDRVMVPEQEVIDTTVKYCFEDFTEDQELLAEDPNRNLEAFNFCLENGDDFDVIVKVNTNHIFAKKFKEEEEYRNNMMPIINGLAIGWAKAFYNKGNPDFVYFSRKFDTLIKYFSRLLKQNLEIEDIKEKVKYLRNEFINPEHEESLIELDNEDLYDYLVEEIEQSGEFEVDDITNFKIKVTKKETKETRIVHLAYKNLIRYSHNDALCEWQRLCQVELIETGDMDMDIFDPFLHSHYFIDLDPSSETSYDVYRGETTIYYIPKPIEIFGDILPTIDAIDQYNAPDCAECVLDKLYDYHMTPYAQHNDFCKIYHEIVEPVREKVEELGYEDWQEIRELMFDMAYAIEKYNN